MIIVQFVKIVQLVQLDYYGYIKFFGAFVGTWVGAFTSLPSFLSQLKRMNWSIFLKMGFLLRCLIIVFEVDGSGFIEIYN